MKQGDINAAALGASTLMAQALSDPAVAEELKSKKDDNFSGSVNTLSGDVLVKFGKIIAACAFLFSLGLFIFYLVKSRKNKDNYHKAIMWRDSLTTFGAAAIFSLGSGLIFFLLALLLYRSYRTRKLKCSTCGAK